MSLHIAKRQVKSRWMALGVPALSVIVALAIGAILMAAVGNDPWLAYRTMAKGTVGSRFALGETFIKAIPLMMTGLGVAVAMQMRLWNIGAEGQLLMGGAAASWLALFGPELPIYLMLPAMVLFGFLGGGFWALIASLPRAIWNVSEIITTLMLNFVAVLIVQYLIQGPWRNPAVPAFPLTASFPEYARLPTLGSSRIHIGLLFAIAVAAALVVIRRRTRWGYEIRVIGSSIQAARYGGMNVTRYVLAVMFVSGGIAGIAGMVELSGVLYQLQDNLAAGVGFTAIIVAALARTHPVGVLIVAFFFGALANSGTSAQSVGVAASVTELLQGAILLALVIGEFFLRYRVTFGRPNRAADVSGLAA